MDHYGENWRPVGALSRMNWTTYVKEGCKDYGARVREKINGILDAGVRKPKSEELIRYFDQQLAQAEEKIAAAKQA